jgi:uncharacterized OB-fold protein
MATEVAGLEIRTFPGTGESSHLIPRVAHDSEPFWAGLSDRQLVLQQCSNCGKSRYPVAPVCPYCRTSTYTWNAVSGAGSVFSWIRYHKVYQPEFEPLMPYSVLTVQLDAGPRMFGRFASEIEPTIGMRVTAIGERWPDGRVLPAFIAEQEI